MNGQADSHLRPRVIRAAAWILLAIAAFGLFVVIGLILDGLSRREDELFRTLPFFVAALAAPAPLMTLASGLGLLAGRRWAWWLGVGLSIGGAATSALAVFTPFVGYAAPFLPYLWTFSGEWRAERPVFAVGFLAYAGVFGLLYRGRRRKGKGIVPRV